MKNTIGVDQRYSVLAALGANADWDSLTNNEVQLIHQEGGEARRAGAEFTRFVKFGYRAQVVDLFRDTGELSIPIPALPRPTLEELRKKFPGIKANGGIERDDSPMEAGTLKLGTVLLPDEEESITGEKFERRILPMRGNLHGYQHGLWLVEHQEEFAALKSLLGKVFILLPGLVVVNGGGIRSVLCLAGLGNRWFLDGFCLLHGVRVCGRVAFSGPLRRSGSEASK